MRFALLLLLLAPLACFCPSSRSVCENDEVCLLAEERPEAFLSVQALADDDVWIVGTEIVPDESGPSAWHWDGSCWTSLPLSTAVGQEMWWVHPTADRVTLVGTGGLILEYDRASETVETMPGPAAAVNFFGVWGAAADDVWAVGGVVSGAEPPALWHRDADGWTEFDAPAGASDGDVYFKVHGVATDDVWVVGEPGILLHWDGVAWAETIPPDGLEASKFLTVAADGTEAIAVGGLGSGIIARWDGGQWHDESVPGSGGIKGVCLREGAAVAVGSSGSVHRYADGVWESDFLPLTFRDYHGCGFTGSGELWIVGGQLGSRPLNEGVIVFEAERGLMSIP
jgi:hypothetical protein